MPVVGPVAVPAVNDDIVEKNIDDPPLVVFIADVTIAAAAPLLPVPTVPVIIAVVEFTASDNNDVASDAPVTFNPPVVVRDTPVAVVGCGDDNVVV